MSDTVILKRKEENTVVSPAVSSSSEYKESILPSVSVLENELVQASKLVDDIVLKKYLHNLSDLEIIPIDDSLKEISDIRLFKITEMVYQKDEYSTYKFASVFSSVQNLNCGVFIIANSDGKKTEFYMGVRSMDEQRTTKSLKDTLKNALVGQFPGAKSEDLLEHQTKAFLSEVPTKNISAVSCVANNKDEDFKDNETFIQGLEKLALAMQGQKYTAVVLAKSTSSNQLEEMRRSYETIYTQLSPFANMQLSYGTNDALNLSAALSHGTTTGTSYTKNTGTSKSTSASSSTSTSESVSKQSVKDILLNSLFSLHSIPTKTKATTTTDSFSESESYNEGESFGKNESTSDNETHTYGFALGKSENMQLTMQNKNLINTLEKIDLQLKRLDECESLGMWECAAYFLSDSQETAEMAAGTYKALMKGTKSGIETSAINYWGRQDAEKLPLLRDYITNFIHPVFAYNGEQGYLPVTTSSLLSSNELAIQMGLPRKSICGLPVIEHADFGKEVVSYLKSKDQRSKELFLGKIFSMGNESEIFANLDINSLTMHTFVTGSTGSGKSNTVYEILHQLHSLYRIPFLVVEPAKGEYKNIFGQFADVDVYGTNPKKTLLLKINPFSFPEDIHILEHLDRLIEIFNVCWPMYAAMPAILKEAVEKAYEATGWDLVASENKNGRKFPNFADVLEQIEIVINDSKYSADSKGDYSGALLTRVRSLTTGLNGLIFSSDEIADECLFDKSVIVDLSRIGSNETKSLIMGLLVMKLNEYRMSIGKINSPLLHITVLEEAHNLLKRTSTEQSSESSNLLGKSVELLTNSIAEMRTYGEGFIIADQAPGLLDMAVIRNTNTKIILRLPERSDRELVGYAAGLNDDQIDELAKLHRGVAAVYQNDWVEPVLVQVKKCELEECSYQCPVCFSSEEKNNIREQLLNFLIQGRVNEKLDFSIEKIGKGLSCLNLTSVNNDCIEEQLEEYFVKNKPSLWKEENFSKLSRLITDIFSARSQVDKYVISAADNAELTMLLGKIVLKVSPESSVNKIFALSQCLMKDMCMHQHEREVRQSIYSKWMKYQKERSIR